MHLRVVARNLREIRRSKDLSRYALAQRLGIAPNYINAFESGRQDPGPSARRELMIALDAGFFELFEVVLVDEESGEFVVLLPQQAN